MTFEELITAYGFPITIIGSLIALSTFMYNRLQEAERRGRVQGYLDEKLTNMQSQLTDILLVVKKHEDINLNIVQKLTILEGQVQAALRLGDDAKERDAYRDNELKELRECIRKINTDINIMRNTSGYNTSSLDDE